MEMPRSFAVQLVAGFITLISVGSVRADEPAKPASPPVADWVKKSNQNARLMVELMARLQPEAAVAVRSRGLRRPDHRLVARFRQAAARGHS